MTTPVPSNTPSLNSPILRGNVTYGGGSSAATTGTVNPTGYVDRELNNQSQQRSGLASAMLSRLQGNTAGGTTGAGYSANPSVSSAMQVQQVGNTGQYHAMRSNAVMSANPIVYNPTNTNSGTQTTTGPGSPTFGEHLSNPIQYNPSTGVTTNNYSGGSTTKPILETITLPNGTTEQEYGTPGGPTTIDGSNYNQIYDPQINNQLNALQANRLGTETSLQLALQQKLGGYTLQQNNANAQDPYNEEGVLARYGGHGLANSSGYQNALEHMLGLEAQRNAGYDFNTNNAQQNYQLALQNAMNKYDQQQVQLDTANSQYAQQQFAANGTSLIDAINKQFGFTAPTYSRNSVDGAIYSVGPDGSKTHLTPSEYSSDGTPGYTSYRGPANYPVLPGQSNPDPSATYTRNLATNAIDQVLNGTSTQLTPAEYHQLGDPGYKSFGTPPKYVRDSKTNAVYQVAANGTRTHLTPAQYAALGKPKFTNY